MEFLSGSRRRRWIALLLMVLALTASGCRRRSPATPPPPPPPNFLALGDQSFDARNYAAAARAYQDFLAANPASPQRDRALFRLALTQFFQGSPVRDLPQARRALQNLLDAHPESQYAPQARLYLELQDEIERQQAGLQLREQRVAELTKELDELQIVDARKREEAESLQAEAARREQRIRQLSEELERLKEIDMRRRPATPRP